jgi:hypothetical protein
MHCRYIIHQKPTCNFFLTEDEHPWRSRGCMQVIDSSHLTPELLKEGGEHPQSRIHADQSPYGVRESRGKCMLSPPSHAECVFITINWPLTRARSAV